MKKLFYILGVAAMVTLFSCNKSDDEKSWDTYREWRNANKTWFAEQESLLDEHGKPFYEKVSGAWSPNEYVLMHWFNDREETAGNLVPLYTSTVGTIYIGRLYNDVAIDSSYLQNDAMLIAQVSGLIEGWQIALQKMHVGDSVQIAIPYQLAYNTRTDLGFPPYSALRFNMRLADITNYETKP